ncbi:hypothetical protein ACOBWA_07230 [Psychrobacter sp. ER1]|uniref:hypothetical protein n=1 Tax=Psychrobacter sp. ER1 TaxID=3406645 RepID=UPI003B431730
MQFRRWATQRLREYLVQGYTLNQQRFYKNSSKLQQALKLIKKTAQSPELRTDKACHQKLYQRPCSTSCYIYSRIHIAFISK